MLKKLAQAVGLMDTPAEAAARRTLLEHYPDWEARGTSTRAKEESRFVIAVFYLDRSSPIRPLPYKLFAVPRDLSAAKEIPCTPDSPYWIRGRK
jgi:hypothetical protein